MIQKQFAVALKALVVREGTVLVMRRSALEEGYTEMWDIPGGRVTWGEDPYEALTREVREETGLQVAIRAPVSIWEFKTKSTKVLDTAIQVVGVTILADWRAGEVQLSPEHDEYRWASLDEIKMLIMDKSLQRELIEFGPWKP